MAWKITPIDQETVSENYKSYMNQNTLLMCRALGIDPSIATGDDNGVLFESSGSYDRIKWWRIFHIIGLKK